MNNFFIDIRNSDEVLSHRFDDTRHNFVNIPSNMIRFNLKFISDIVKSGKYNNIYLVCRSGNRSKLIYNKYFANDNILNKIITRDELNFNNYKNNPQNISELGLVIYTVKGPRFNLYNMMRVIQLVLGSILLLSGIGLYGLGSVNKHFWILWIMIIMGTMAIYNGLTGTCTISKVFINYIN